ncbi:hypothetical protein [Nocardia sp. NPDC057668]|uniref:hypothetical protein n=1 Tax=Nocardia sp. NPDC057668 TaxID=3346202 RepID=UPI0036713C36
MNLRTTTFAALAAAAALTVAAAPAGAEPAPEYRSEIVNGTVVTTLRGASFTLAPDGRSVRVHDDAGRPVLSLPLAIELDGATRPIGGHIADQGRTLTLTPRPVASPLENQLALTEFAGSLTRASLTATIGGFVIGALVGAAMGLGSCLLVGPACLATTPAAIMAFAAGGGVAATLTLGGAALAQGLWKYVTTLQAPPGASEYALQDGLLDPNGTGAPDATLRLPPLPLRPLITGSASRSAG